MECPLQMVEWSIFAAVFDVVVLGQQSRQIVLSVPSLTLFYVNWIATRLSPFDINASDQNSIFFSLFIVSESNDSNQRPNLSSETSLECDRFGWGRNEMTGRYNFMRSAEMWYRKSFTISLINSDWKIPGLLRFLRADMRRRKCLTLLRIVAVLKINCWLCNEPWQIANLFLFTKKEVSWKLKLRSYSTKTRTVWV